MNLWSAFLVGLKEILANKFRSVLTMLGIILGVSSLVAMSALIQGMENGAREALVNIGGLERISIDPAPLPSYQRHLQDEATGLTIEDLYALKRNVPLLTNITPEMRLPPVTITRGPKNYRPMFVNASWPTVLDIYQYQIAHGRMFNEIDDEMARNVCVIGTATRDALFGSPLEMGREIIPIGEQISINGPQSVTLSPQTLVVVLQALNELPYKIAQPAIAEIMAQVVFRITRMPPQTSTKAKRVPIEVISPTTEMGAKALKQLTKTMNSRLLRHGVWNFG